MTESLSTASPRPSVEGGLSESVRELCELSDAELAAKDIAESNLLVARGLPGAEDLDVGECLRTLDAWANLVGMNTAHWWPKFVASPGENEHSPGKFRMLALVTVLQRYLGVSYYLPFSQGEYDGTDSRNLFLHGILSGHGGTCVTMPILYIAVGRRLGYPLKLVRAKQHFFVRWDDPDGEHFNIESTSPGFVSHDDAYYHARPRPLSDTDIASGVFLRSLTPREELASFLGDRGTCLTEHLHTYTAMEAFHYADALHPDHPCLRGGWATATMLWRMIEQACRVTSCTHAQFVAAMQSRADRNQLSYDTLPFPKPENDADRWAISNAREVLRRILGNVIRKRRSNAHELAFATLGDFNDY